MPHQQKKVCRLQTTPGLRVRLLSYASLIFIAQVVHQLNELNSAPHTRTTITRTVIRHTVAGI